MRYFLFVFLLSVVGCASNSEPVEPPNSANDSIETSPMVGISNDFDWQGHRGCRGLMPENTIPALLHAIDLGVTTLEFDVVITADSQVVLSHEPFFSHEIATGPDGTLITEADEKQHNIFKMSWAELQYYDVGMRPHSRFPDQEKMAITKPLLSEVFEAVDAHIADNNLQSVRFNIETKCKPSTDNEFHPVPDVFAQLLWDEVKKAGVEERTTIQSFDVRTLQYLKAAQYAGPLALLVENEQWIDANIDSLGFDPDIYSCYFMQVDIDLVEYAHARNILVIPWTVNTVDAMIELKQLGVDGIITDYPNLISEL